MQWAAGSHGYPTQTHWEQWRICLTEQVIKVNLKFFRYEQPVCANRYHKSVFNHQTYFILAFFLIYVDWKFFCPTPLFLAHCITLLSKLWFSWKFTTLPSFFLIDKWYFFERASLLEEKRAEFRQHRVHFIGSVLRPSSCLPSPSNFTAGGKRTPPMLYNQVYDGWLLGQRISQNLFSSESRI